MSNHCCRKYRRRSRRLASHLKDQIERVATERASFVPRIHQLQDMEQLLHVENAQLDGSRRALRDELIENQRSLLSIIRASLLSRLRYLFTGDVNDLIGGLWD